MKSVESILKELNDVFVIDHSIKHNKYVPIDLSISNETLTRIDLKNSNDFENYVNHYLEKNNAVVAFGGYNEVRNLYKRSNIFNDNESEERNIHIGLDLWTNAGTTVLAALDGIVHSFKYNKGLGNYGPTVILEHNINEYKFYTLYGHLSEESLLDLKVGDKFIKGQIIATLGKSDVNGDYAPHLHFQIIKDIENYFGDYPGVCTTKDLPFFLDNCPDPNLLLKIS